MLMADGEVSKASLMLNDKCDPPQRQSLWSALAELNEALRPIVKEIKKTTTTTTRA
jgi:hypothetical protein